MKSSAAENWQMHESTSRGLCRLAFMILAVGPLVLCSIWSAATLLPQYDRWHRGSWERLLSSKLGLRVSIESSEWLSPNRVQLSSIRFENLETNALVAEIESADLRLYSSRSEAYLAKPVIHAGQIQETWNLLHDRLLCHPDDMARLADLSADQLLVHGDVDDHLLRDVRLRLDPAKQDPEIWLAFVPPQSNTPSGDTQQEENTETVRPSVLIVQRQRNASRAETVADLKTGAHSLPGNLLAAFYPAFEKLGDQARFLGSVHLVRRRSSWNIEPAPKNAADKNGIAETPKFIVQDIDFGRLTWGTNAYVQGFGSMSIWDLQTTNYGIERLHGNVLIQARSGESGRDAPASISSRFLESVCRNLSMSSQLGEFSDGAHYLDYLEMQFFLAAGELHLVGEIRDHQNYLAYRGSDMWESAITLDRLVQTLQDAVPPQVFQDKEGDPWLARQAAIWLPLNATAGSLQR
ncbi:MAG: hypothetical protein KDB22_15165 [Planctomycetales bacterium]|nr:hypothetical protein [Planctomycetales bacterium]